MSGINIKRKEKISLPFYKSLGIFKYRKLEVGHSNYFILSRWHGLQTGTAGYLSRVGFHKLQSM
jgi:hypothetical protein